ncbi:MAG: methyltransferase domain-containing protein [Alphaproteobacteria bacterium]|nr:methyltransferase domain-containing protein [Alphaproteobacteria bacterium]
MDKDSVKKCFDKSADTYDSVSEVQKFAATDLIDLINLANVTSVIDIGCGTGNASLELLKKYPDANVTLCDISENMLKVAAKKLNKPADMICYDAEKYAFDRHYDLGVSNLCLQWFSDIDAFLEKVHRFCNVFAFSTLLNSSFENYKKLFSKPPTFRYPSLKELTNRHAFKKYCTKKYTLEFENFFGVAKYFRKLGAYSKSHDTDSHLIVSDQPVSLEYDIFFAIL